MSLPPTVLAGIVQAQHDRPVARAVAVPVPSVAVIPVVVRLMAAAGPTVLCSVSGWGVPASSSAEASALAPSHVLATNSGAQSGCAPEATSSLTEPRLAVPLAVFTKPESTWPETYGRFMCNWYGVGLLQSSSEAQTVNDPADASPQPTRRGSGGGAALNR